MRQSQVLECGRAGTMLSLSARLIDWSMCTSRCRAALVRQTSHVLALAFRQSSPARSRRVCTASCHWVTSQTLEPSWGRQARLMQKADNMCGGAPPSKSCMAPKVDRVAGWQESVHVRERLNRLQRGNTFTGFTDSNWRSQANIWP